jgi:hypothetical protein
MFHSRLRAITLHIQTELYVMLARFLTLFDSLYLYVFTPLIANERQLCRQPNLWVNKPAVATKIYGEISIGRPSATDMSWYVRRGDRLQPKNISKMGRPECHRHVRYIRLCLIHQDLSDGTSQVTNMRAMFHQAPSLQRRYLWMGLSVTTMENMFRDAIVFNQDLSDGISRSPTCDLFYRSSAFTPRHLRMGRLECHQHKAVCSSLYPYSTKTSLVGTSRRSPVSDKNKGHHRLDW